MKDRFDELTKAMAQSVTRRAALKKFGVGLTGMVLACFGLANKAEATNAACNLCIKEGMRAGFSHQQALGMCRFWGVC